MAAGEEGLEGFHEKGGTTSSSLMRSEISSTTKGGINSEPVSCVEKVIESQHIGGEC